MRGRGGVEMFGLVNGAQSFACFAEGLVWRCSHTFSHTQPQIGGQRAQRPDDSRGLSNKPTINETESLYTHAAIYTRTVSLLIYWSRMDALHLCTFH